MLTIRHRLFISSMSVACLANGCGSQSFVASDTPASEDLLAVKVADYTGADALSAKADAVTDETTTVSLPAELAENTADEIVIALTPADIVVMFDSNAAGRMHPTAKIRAARASIGFRLAESQEDACVSEFSVGPFELTITDGTASIDPAELPIPTEALALLGGGRVALCAEMWADFDGSIALGRVSFESGRLGGGEDRAVLCHSPSDNDGDAHTITVGSSSLDRHLAHGDYLGECDATAGGNSGDSNNDEDSEDEQDDGDTDEDESDDDIDDGSPDEDADDTGENTPDSAFAIIVDAASCDPATGHCYILARNPDGSNDRLWWDDARIKANTMGYGGMRGHLATITSSAERQFLAGVAGNTPAMLGGTDRDEEGLWLWADGPESGQAIDFLPWADGEPNDLYHWTYPEGEDYLQHEGRGFNDINGARWYYVEFEPN